MAQRSGTSANVDSDVQGMTAQTGDDDESGQPKKSGYGDKDAISQEIDKALRCDAFSRYLFENDWARNIFFLVGMMWIKKVNGRWQNRNLPVWFPRAQTNKFAEKSKDLVGQLVTGQRIPITFTPATDSEADLGMAEVATRIRDVYYTEAKVDEIEELIASWVINTGNCFAIPSYDMDEKHGMAFVQFQRCTQCGEVFKPEDLAEEADQDEPQCPDCGGALADAESPEGEPLGDEYPRGAIQLDVASPFEIRGDHRVSGIDKWHWFVRQKRYDVDFAKDKWKDFADSIVPDGGGDDPGQYYLDIISNLTSSADVGRALVTSGNPSSKNPKCTAYEFYKLPCEKYPQGLKAIRVGKSSEAMVEVGPLTTMYGAGVKKGQYWLPLIHFGYEIVPGRFWRKTPMDDVVPLQLFRNTVDANLRLTVQRMGNALWLLPKGCGVDILTGEPGQSITYNPITVGGTQIMKPERVPAELNNLGALLALLKEIDDAIEHVSGATLQGGQTPPGVTAASALAYLGEKEQQALSTLRSSYAKSWRQFDEYALELARQNWDDEHLRVIAGENKKWQVEKFTKGDLQGSVNILIDYNGIAPKSSATEQAKIAQLTQLGAVNAQDPSVRVEVLKKFGAMNLMGSANTDIEYAAKLKDKFLGSGGSEMGVSAPRAIPNFRPGVDNSQILLREAIEFAKTDEFLELPPDDQNTWTSGWCQLLIQDIAQRRVYLTAAGLDPDVPALEEIPTALAQAGLVAGAQAQSEVAAAAQQSGGQANGAQAPDPRLDNTGNPRPGSGLPGAPPSPDIADLGSGPPNSIKPEGSPRAIPLPPNA